jgi:general secretion pathway protein M
MNASNRIERFLRNPRIAALSYGICLLVVGLVAVSAVADFADRYGAMRESEGILARLEQRTPLQSPESGWSSDAVPPGSPFLEGPTVTVASAALLERLTSAVVRAGGEVVSFEVEPQSAQSKDGYVKVVANCELEASQLQQLLFDVETGMPFLFVDQFVAQAPVPTNDRGRLRVLLAVSGLWTGANP